MSKRIVAHSDIIRRLRTKHSGIVLVDKLSNEWLPIENIKFIIYESGKTIQSSKC